MVDGRRSYPRQIEYGRLNLEYTVTSKRKLGALVEAGAVEGWDDPRMPTLAGLRRRGIPAAAIRLFCSRVGVARVGGSVVEQSMLETSVREVLEGRADDGQAAESSVATGNWVIPRAMAVREPLPVTLTTLTEPLQLSLPRHPDHTELGCRTVPLTREIFIERADFMEEDEAAAVPGGFKRLTPGQAVRLRGAYVIRCSEVVRDPGSGKVLRLHCVCVPHNDSLAHCSALCWDPVLFWLLINHSWALLSFVSEFFTVLAADQGWFVFCRSLSLSRFLSLFLSG